jgi:alanine dehydrogenase
MEFGVPKEVRDLEMRVGLTPAGVLDLSQAGHSVYVERDAGAGVGCSDQDYHQAGASIVYSATVTDDSADAVVKIAQPAAQSHPLFRSRQVILSFLHFSVETPNLLEALIRREITTFACQTIQDEDGLRPVRLPMSEIARRLISLVADQLLWNYH